MWYVLCERGDLAALWAFRGLRERGLAPIEIVSGDEIAAALRIDHRIGASGVTTELHLARGLTISSATARGVLNRLVVPPAAGQALAAPEDREYARQEVMALTMSWLHGLPCPVLGRPSPQGLAGPWLHQSEWITLAARAGLHPVPYRRSSADDPDAVGPAAGRMPTGAHRTAFWALDPRVAGLNDRGPDESDVVVDGAPGAAPPEVVAGIRRLGRLVGAGLLGVELGADWAFVAASPLPDLRSGGAPLLDLIASALGGPRVGR